MNEMWMATLGNAADQRTGSPIAHRACAVERCKSVDFADRETAAVELLPREAGEFAFACPMSMFRRQLIVE